MAPVFRSFESAIIKKYAIPLQISVPTISFVRNSIIASAQSNYQGRRFENSSMPSQKPSHPQPWPKNKQPQSENIMKSILKQLSPLARLNSAGSSSKANSKQKKSALFLRSTRYTSPNSCQSSGVISKQHSREKTNGLKNRPDPTGNIRKKRRKNSLQRVKECEKENEGHQVSRMAREQFKKTIWKNKVLKEFVVRDRRNALSDSHNIGFLERSLQLYSTEQGFQSGATKSFFSYLLGDGVEVGSRKTCLAGLTRIITLDWMYLIGASLLLGRETVHLAIHYLDSYLSERESELEKVHILAAAALLLAVKQQERELQPLLLSTVCMSEQFQVLQDQVIGCEQSILVKLNFKLKSNTIAFWADYFALKWDKFVGSSQGESAFAQASFDIKINLRSSDGECYRMYRELVQLCDVCLMFPEYVAFEKSKLALACVYLVLRIESEKVHGQQNGLNIEQEDYFKLYYKLFTKKASPIFKDPYRINQIFNTFLTETCEFEITEIIPCIKLVANFLEIDFCYSIDEKAMQEAKSYEDFIRRMTYSYQMKDYCLLKIS